MCAVLPLLHACGGTDNPNGNGKPQCSDGIDNDGDGMIDFPDDLGCTSATDNSEDSPDSPQCSDGRDNDGDGKTDYPEDPGCFSPNNNSEVDDCPSGPMCPQCSNGKDDDGNGLTDYPNDPGCSSAGDPTEATENVAACGGTMIDQLDANGGADGTLDGTSTFSVATATCGGGANTSAIAYEIHLTQPKVLIATTANGDTTVDTIIDVRSTMCSDPSSEVACNDNGDATDTSNLSSTVTVSLQPGTYYVIVEGYDPSITGAFHLDVQLLAGEGATCGSDGDCGTGLNCNPAAGGTMVCAKPLCSNGSDDDGDGKTDFPNDPGCSSPTDNSETDSCPNGSDCPACSNGVDDDGDHLIDYPADPSCQSAGGTSESCTTIDPILDLTGPDTQGTLVGAHDDFLPDCAFEPGGLDQVYQITVPRLLTLDAVAENADFDFEADTYLLNTTCGGSDLACEADGDAIASNLPAGSYFIVVDDDFPEFDTPSTFDLTVSGTVAPGESCEGSLFTSGVLTCGGGSTCSGSAGSQTCVPPQCSDGSDNNGDGKIDYPNDPGCTSPTDNTETTVCPGVNCPVCANGSDDDSDGKTDFPADFGCSSAGGASEVFCALDPDNSIAITTGTTTSTFVGSTADLLLDCGDATGKDRTFALQLPVNVTSLSLDTDTSAATDTVLELWSPQCTGEIACNDDADLGTNDDSEINLGPTQAGNYAVSVQTYSSGNTKAFVLHTHGVVAAGTACTSPLFSGSDAVLTCAAGSTCTAGKCQ